MQEILEVTNLIWLLTLHPSIIMKKTVGGLSLPSNILLQMSDIQADGGGNESLKKGCSIQQWGKSSYMF